MDYLLSLAPAPFSMWIKLKSHTEALEPELPLFTIKKPSWVFLLRLKMAEAKGIEWY